MYLVSNLFTHRARSWKSFWCNELWSIYHLITPTAAFSLHQVTRLGKLKISSRVESKVIYILINEIASSTVSLRDVLNGNSHLTFFSRSNFINKLFYDDENFSLFIFQKWIYFWVRRESSFDDSFSININSQLYRLHHAPITLFKCSRKHVKLSDKDSLNWESKLEDFQFKPRFQ